jgi:hypothetical protein
MQCAFFPQVAAVRRVLTDLTTNLRQQLSQLGSPLLDSLPPDERAFASAFPAALQRGADAISALNNALATPSDLTSKSGAALSGLNAWASSLPVPPSFTSSQSPPAGGRRLQQIEPIGGGSGTLRRGGGSGSGGGGSGGGGGGSGGGGGITSIGNVDDASVSRGAFEPDVQPSTTTTSSSGGSNGILSGLLPPGTTSSGGNRGNDGSRNGAQQQQQQQQQQQLDGEKENTWDKAVDDAQDKVLEKVVDEVIKQLDKAHDWLGKTRDALALVKWANADIDRAWQAAHVRAGSTLAPLPTPLPSP